MTLWIRCSNCDAEWDTEFKDSDHCVICGDYGIKKVEYDDKTGDPILLTESIELLKQSDFYLSSRDKSIIAGDMKDRINAFLRKVEGE